MTTPAENREWIIQRWSGSELLYEDWLGAEVFDAAARQMTGIELMTRFRDAPGIRVVCEEMAG